MADIDIVTDRRYRTEELLRTEIRHSADVILKLVQWGVTLQVAVATIIFYGRREIKADLATLHIPTGALLPWEIHLIGTLFLVMLASMFTVLLLLTQRRRVFYRTKLYELDDKLIKEGRPTTYTNWIYPPMFWSFPAVDLIIRVYFAYISGA